MQQGVGKKPDPKLLFTHVLEDGRTIVVDIEHLDPSKEILIPISPEQAYHSNGLFSAFLKFADENNLKIRLINTSYLRRFTIQLEKGQEEINEKVFNATNKVNNQWDELNLEGKNKAVVDKMKKEGRFVLTHWEDWTSERSEHFALFSLARKEIENIDEQIEGNFHKALDAAVNDFFKGFHKRYEARGRYPRLYNNIGEQGVKQVIRNYLLEECAVILMWQKLGYTQMAYPFGQNTTGKKTADAVKACYKTLPPELKPESNIPMNLLNLVVKEKEPSPRNQAAAHRGPRKPSDDQEELPAARPTRKGSANQDDLAELLRKAEEAEKERVRVEQEKQRIVAQTVKTAANIKLLTEMGLTPDVTIAAVQQLANQIIAQQQPSKLYTDTVERTFFGVPKRSPGSSPNTQRQGRTAQPFVENGDKTSNPSSTSGSNTGSSGNSSEGSSPLGSAGSTPPGVSYIESHLPATSQGAPSLKKVEIRK